MDIRELEKKVIAFRDARDWGQYHNPKDLAISLSLETAELVEIFQWKNAREVEATKNDPETRKRVKEELGDILIYALNMCYAFGFDSSSVDLQRSEPRHIAVKLSVSHLPLLPGGRYG
jgi:dCTP diphosphatase